MGGGWRRHEGWEESGGDMRVGGGGGDMRDGRRWRRHEGWEEVEET